MNIEKINLRKEVWMGVKRKKKMNNILKKKKIVHPGFYGLTSFNPR